tara:strand:+ start:525 stop:767 length:243 start_codon:yes stop_codon:yes gene_type:complete
MSKIYIENSKFMEFIDEIVTRIVEERFGEEAYTEGSLQENEDGFMIFNENAQEFYNEAYDEYETLANNLLGVYSNNELNK